MNVHSIWNCWASGSLKPFFFPSVLIFSCREKITHVWCSFTIIWNSHCCACGFHIWRKILTLLRLLSEMWKLQCCQLLARLIVESLEKCFCFVFYAHSHFFPQVWPWLLSRSVRFTRNKQFFSGKLIFLFSVFDFQAHTSIFQNDSSTLTV